MSVHFSKRKEKNLKIELSYDPTLSPLEAHSADFLFYLGYTYTFMFLPDLFTIARKQIYFAVYEQKNGKEKCGTHSGKLINFKENVIMKFEHKFAKLENIIPNYILRSRKTNTFILSHAEM